MISIEGHYEVKKNGKLERKGRNLLTNDFLLALLEGLVNNGATAQPWDIAADTITFVLGTDNTPPPLVTDVALQAQILELNPTSKSFTRLGVEPMQARLSFYLNYISAVTNTIVEAGMKFKRTSGSKYLISRWLIDSLIIEPNDSIEVTWVLYFRRDFSA